MLSQHDKEEYDLSDFILPEVFVAGTVDKTHYLKMT